MTFTGGTELDVPGKGSRAAECVCGWVGGRVSDTVCEKLQLSDLRHTIHRGDQRAELSKAARCRRFKGAPVESGKRKGRTENTKREKKTDLKAQQIIFRYIK